MLKIILIQRQMIKMKKITNIAIIGLGQIGSYLYNELKIKKKEIEKKTGRKIKVIAVSAKNKDKSLKLKS